MTYLTDRFFLFFAAFQFLGVSAYLFPALFLPYLLSWPALIGIMLLDLRTLPRANAYRASGRLSSSPEIGESVALFLEIASPLGKRLGQMPRAALPPLKTLFTSERLPRLHAKASEGRLSYGARVAVHGCALGYEEMKEVRVLCESRLRLWFRDLSVALDPGLGFRVMPSRKRISEQAFRQLAANQRLFQQGSRKILRGRAAELFHSIRKYQFPDEIRHIDQKKSARYSTLMTRTFETFLNHHLVIGLDLGHSMFGRLGRSRKNDFYLSAALMLAQNAIQSHDQVSFFAFSQRAEVLIPRTRSLERFLPIYRGAPELRPRDEESDFDWVPILLQKLAGSRSIVLLFTDTARPSVQASLSRVLPGVCQKHLTVVVSLLDEGYSIDARVERGGDEARSLTFDAYARDLYAYWLSDREQVFRRKIAQWGGGMISATEGDWLSVVARTYELMRRSLSI